MVMFPCYRYDPKTDTWTMVASMSHGKDGIGVILFGDKLFSVGGYDGHQYKTVVEVYDPQTNEWTQVLRMALNHILIRINI